jgi:hypothetical protein
MTAKKDEEAQEVVLDLSEAFHTKDTIEAGEEHEIDLFSLDGHKRLGTLLCQIARADSPAIETAVRNHRKGSGLKITQSKGRQVVLEMVELPVEKQLDIEAQHMLLHLKPKPPLSRFVLANGTGAPRNINGAAWQDRRFVLERLPDLRKKANLISARMAERYAEEVQEAGES